MKRENEAVVNRFLLSTLYIVIGEFLLYFLWRATITGRGAVMSESIYEIMLGISAVGTVICLVLIALNKGRKAAKYYLAVSLIALVIFAFLRFYYPLYLLLKNAGPKVEQIFFYANKRYSIVGIFAAIFYVYEVVYYFVNVRKPQK